MVGPLPPTPTPGAPERLAVRAMFDRIAPRYDLLNRLLSAGTDVRWRRAAVDFLELPAPARVLDLCTGTADLLIEWIGRGAGNSGVGLDLSEAMLRRASRKLAAHAGGGRGLLACGDAERLPVADAVFDGALVAFGVRNVAVPEAGLRELARVLRRGARLVVLEFSTPPGTLGRLYRLYFRHILPRLGGLISGDRGAYAYLPASVDRFPAPRDFGALMAGAGFERVEWRPLSLGIAHLYRGVRP